jgi:hypothetical protein
VTPLGSLVYQQRQGGVIGSAGDVDQFTLPLAAGQSVTLVVVPNSSLAPTVTLHGPDGGLLGQTSAGPGGTAVLQNVAGSDAGTYTIALGGSAGSTGEYSLLVLVNAAVDRDGPGGGNTSAAEAQDLASAWTALSGGGRRAAVVGLPPAMPERVVLYSADMTASPGWSLQGGWQYGIPTGQGSEQGDPTSGFTGSSVVGYNLAGNYPGNLATAQYATTPRIDTRDFRQVRLGFYRWLGLDYAPGDGASIQVSHDGVSGQTIWSHTVQGMIRDMAWTYQEYDLSTLADDTSTT